MRELRGKTAFITGGASGIGFARWAKESFGHVHLVCDNAGVGAGGPLDQCTFDDWDWVVGVNLTGVINGVQAPHGIGVAVRDAVEADELWVLTHPDLAPFVAERGEPILAGFKAQSASSIGPSRRDS